MITAITLVSANYSTTSSTNLPVWRFNPLVHVPARLDTHPCILNYRIGDVAELLPEGTM